jgi:long-subunit fatty acid transport protein
MKRYRRRSLAFLTGLLILTVSAGEIRALTDEEIFREFRFNFISPGAHALGLGGAYIAAAEDATAAEANPAALHYVSRKELFVEFRRTEPEDQILRPSRGARYADPANKAIGSTDNYTDFELVTGREDVNFPSFASFVMPFQLGKRRARVALSRQVVLDTESSLALDPLNETRLVASFVGFPIAVVPDPDNPGEYITERYQVENTVLGTLDAELVHYNLGFSVSLGRDFSLGFTGTLADLTMETFVESDTFDPKAVLNSVHPRIDTGQGAPNLLINTDIDDSDTDFAYTVGLHWHPDAVFPSGYSPIRFGVVYRKGAELSVQETVRELDTNTGSLVPIEEFDNVLAVPDRWGAGVAYRTNHWLLSADIERIEYSDLLKDYRERVNFFTSPAFEDIFDEAFETLVFDVDDATVYRVGAEYSLRTRGGWIHSLRGGYYNAPDNKIFLKSFDSGDPQIDQIYLDLFRGGEDIDHYTVGFTLGTPADVHLQFAGDFSDAGDQFVGSAIYRFGKIR